MNLHTTERLTRLTDTCGSWGSVSHVSEFQAEGEAPLRNKLRVQVPTLVPLPGFGRLSLDLGRPRRGSRPRRPASGRYAPAPMILGRVAATTRLGVKKKTYSTKTDVDFPNQTPTQTVSLIPTPRLYTKVRTSL